MTPEDREALAVLQNHLAGYYVARQEAIDSLADYNRSIDETWKKIEDLMAQPRAEHWKA